MSNSTSSGSGFPPSGSREILEDQFLQNFHNILHEGTHHRGEVRSCYISHRFANDRHNHFRDFRGARQVCSPTSEMVAAGKESFPEYQHKFGAPFGPPAVLNKGPESGPTKDQGHQAAAAVVSHGSSTNWKQSVSVDLAHRLHSCRIGDPMLPSSSQSPFDGMEQEVPQDHQFGEPHHGQQNPDWLGHNRSERSRDVFPIEECQCDDLMQL